MTSWVEELRSQFAVTEKTVFLDVAYENCGGRFLGEADERFYADWADVSPGVVKAGGAGKGRIIEVVAETRRLIAELLGGVDPGHVAFTKNTNEGINIVLQGFPFRAGDNVVTWDQEHSSVLMPCLNLERRGVECRVAVSPDGVSVTPDLLWQRVDKNTRIIGVSHVQSRTGYRIDLEGLARRCREAGIYLVVDAIQSLGFCPLDAAGWGVDAVATACYKGLLGAAGSGFLYCRGELLEQLWPVYAADNACLRIVNDDGNWSISCDDPGDARKLENSTLNFAGIYQLHAGLRQLLAIGMDAIHAHITELVDVLYAGLTELGYRIVTPADRDRRCHSLAMTMDDVKAGFAYFQSRGVFLSLSAGRYIRMSVAPFTTRGDIERTLAVARDCPVR